MPLSVPGWEPPRRMPGYTRLSVAVLDELSGVSGLSAASAGYNLYERTLDDWPRRAVDILIREQQVIGETGQPRLLEADAEASGAEVRPSTVPGAGLGLFATRTLAVGERIPFFGQLVYHDLQVAARSNGARLRGQLYGSGVVPPSLATTARNWLYTGLQLRAHGSLWQSSSSYHHAAMVPTAVGSVFGLSSEAYPRPVWVVPSDFCAGGRVNDPRPHLWANSEFNQQFDPVVACSELVMADCAFLSVTQTIAAGEEVLAMYGRRYPLHAHAIPVSSGSGRV